MRVPIENGRVPIENGRGTVKREAPASARPAAYAASATWLIRPCNKVTELTVFT